MRPTTDMLIDTLVLDVPPVRAGAVERRVLAGLAIGAVLVCIVIFATLGVRPDLAQAVHRPTIWMKWGYTASLGAIALYALLRLARPERRGLGMLWTFVVPVVLLGVVAAVDMARTPPAAMPHLWFGHSWRHCSMLVLALSLPIFGGFLWAIRALAPTRLRLAGAMAGLSAGGFAATLYGFACQETSALFVLTWYSLGIVAPMLIGSIIGPRVLRW